jgi:1,5-anhydro-D-fructose reductase (1,5-anhydro-D-mannitol-forming)
VNDTGRAVRVVVIGCGLIGGKRLEAIGQLEDASLAATIDPFREPGVATGAPHYAGLDELAPGSYDAAIISVPHDAAPALTQAVLAGGKPVLVEKPLATSSTVARELEELAATVPLPSYVGYNYRFLPAIREVMTIAAEGRLGRLRSIDMLVGHGGHPDSGMGWKLDPRRAGGGVLIDPGVHLLDLLLQLAANASCVSAEATSGFWGTGVEEDVALTFRAETVLITLRVSHIRWINTFRLELFGEDAYCIAEGRGGNYGPMILRFGERWGWTGSGSATQKESERVHDFGITDTSLRDELAYVTRMWRVGEVADRNVHPASFAEARAVIELLEKLYAQMR